MGRARDIILAGLALPGAWPALAQPFSIRPDAGADPSALAITVFASGLNYPHGMVMLDDGSLLVATSRPVSGGSFFNSTGEIVRLVDADEDGVADGPPAVVAAGLPGSLVDIRRIGGAGGAGGAGGLLLAASTAAGAESIRVLRLGAAGSDPLVEVGAIEFALAPGTIHKPSALAARPSPGVAGAWDVFFQIGSRNNADATTDPAIVSGLVTGTAPQDALWKVTIVDDGAAVSGFGLEQIGAGLRNAAGIALHPTTGDLYHVDNGIDGPDGESLSADELNVIRAIDIGGAIEHFGFPDTYVEYRTGVVVGSTGLPALATFQPLPDPFTDAESEGAAAIVFAPPCFPAAVRGGAFVSFHGRFSLAGLANEENPLVFVNPATGVHAHFIGPDEPAIGHLDGLLATENALYAADLSSAGSLSTGAGTGVIYRIGLAPAPCDLDGAPGVTVFDLLAYLGLWFAGDAAAELTGDDPASVDVFDLLAYLACWFERSGPCG